MRIFRLTVRRLFAVVFLCLLIKPGTADAQILQDNSSMELIKRGVDHIYNSEFGYAEDILTAINTKYPAHPATYLYMGMMIYYQNYPLLPSSPISRNFEAQLRTSMRICEAKEGWLDDPETLLIDLCARGLLLLYYSENEVSGEVFPIAATTWKCIRKSFLFTSVYPDFDYFTGLYNYYREAYPENHPVYKPLAVLFPPGNKEKGLTELQHAAENSIILRAESYSILSWICLHYEYDFHKALDYSKTLYDNYQANLLFKGEYLKNLFLLKEYDEAEKMILSSGGAKNRFFQGQLAIFNGLLQEKKYQNYQLAGKFYEDGINDMKYFGARGASYSEYGKASLKRIKDLQDGKQSERKKKSKNSDNINLDLLSLDD